MAAGQRVLGLRLAFHDRLHRGLPAGWLEHHDPACRAVRAEHQPTCAAFCGGAVHAELAARPDGRVHDCPFGHVEAVAPVLEEGQLGGILYAGPCWRGPEPPPRPGLRRVEDEAWLTDRLLLLRALGQELGRLLRAEHAPLPATRRQIVLDAIRARLAERVELGDVAAALHLSPGHAGRVVRELFGVPFPRLVHRLKTREAARLLAGTDLPLARIAAATGYTDQAHLSRTFKQHFGLPPGAYRRRHGGRV